MKTYQETAQKTEKGKELSKVFIYEIYGSMLLCIAVDKDENLKNISFRSRVLKRAVVHDNPVFVGDSIDLWEDTEVKEPFIRFTVDELKRLSYFVASRVKRTTYREHFYFPWIWHDDELDKTWIVAADVYRAIMYRNKGIPQNVKKTFPFPPLWEVFRLSKSKAIEVHLFPDIAGEPCIRLFHRKEKKTLAVMWWETDKALNDPPSFSKVLYPAIGVKKPNPEFTFKTLGRIQIKKKEDPCSPVTYMDGDLAVNTGQAVQVTIDFEPEHPLQFCGDLLKLNLGRTYTLSLCRKIGSNNILGWYSFALKVDPSEEEYVIYPARVPDDVIRLSSDDRTSYYKG